MTMPSASSWRRRSGVDCARSAQPTVESSWQPDGIDLAGLYELADEINGRASHDRGHQALTERSLPSSTLMRLLDDPKTRILVCCGSGGVGKTTTAAAVAVARCRSWSTCLCSDDRPGPTSRPVDRACHELDNTPRQIPGVGAERRGALRDDAGHEAHVRRDRRTARGSRSRAEQILANPFYQTLSSSFAGTQEYMAMEKLGQLHRRRVDPERGISSSSTLHPAGRPWTSSMRPSALAHFSMVGSSDCSWRRRVREVAPT